MEIPPSESAAMLHIVLIEPEIAPNTGNIARLCAATGTRLHLVGRLGFRLDAHALRRAGVDYWDHVDVARHDDWPAFESAWAGKKGDCPSDSKGQSPFCPGGSLWMFTARGGRTYTSATFQDGDALVFGCESRGLPDSIRERDPTCILTIPMTSPMVRSLNLATAAGIALYEALRQTGRWA
jgi:tRNA (cytidine/uridine-2'-O-)-methyltransferase